MKPEGFLASLGAVTTRQVGACLRTIAGLGMIGAASALSLNAIDPDPDRDPDRIIVTSAQSSGKAQIEAPTRIDLPMPNRLNPEPISAPPAISGLDSQPSRQPVTVIAVTPTITETALPSCVTELAALTQGLALHFPLGGATLSDAEQGVLLEVGKKATACPDALVQIEGHTDSVGPDALNLKLSWRRAENTLAALEALGIETSQFEPVGFGARAPMAQGDASEDHLNRRVEFTVLKRPESGA